MAYIHLYVSCAAIFILFYHDAIIAQLYLLGPSPHIVLIGFNCDRPYCLYFCNYVLPIKFITFDTTFMVYVYMGHLITLKALIVIFVCSILFSSEKFNKIFTSTCYTLIYPSNSCDDGHLASLCPLIYVDPLKRVCFEEASGLTQCNHVLD